MNYSLPLLWHHMTRLIESRKRERRNERIARVTDLRLIMKHISNPHRGGELQEKEW